MTGNRAPILEDNPSRALESSFTQTGFKPTDVWESVRFFLDIGILFALAPVSANTQPTTLSVRTGEHTDTLPPLQRTTRQRYTGLAHGLHRKSCGDIDEAGL